MNNIFEGYGEYNFESKKLTYARYWFGGVQHGEGKLIDMEGTEIFSHWNNGRISGKGLIRYSNSEKYEGEINENGIHRDGKYYFSSGEWIEGKFENDILAQNYAAS